VTTVYNHTIYEFAVRNDSGEEIPAFAVMQPTAPVAIGDRLVFPVVKPGAASAGWPRFYLINGPFVIPVAGSGNGTRAKADNPAQVLRRKAPPLTYGEDWGVVDGKWYLDRIYMGGYCALGPEAAADGVAAATDTTKSLFHSEGPNEPFLVEINGTLEEDDLPGEAQIMEQQPIILDEDGLYVSGGGFTGIGRNIELWAWNLPDHGVLVGQVWVKRSERSGVYNVLINSQGYIPQVSAAKLQAASDTDPVALVSEL
jgi:hypothetical protein